MGAKRWPPVWLQRHTRASDAAGGQLDVQQRAPPPAARVAPAVAAHEHLGRRVADDGRPVALRPVGLVEQRGRAGRGSRRPRRGGRPPSRRWVPVRRWCTTRRSPSRSASACGTTVITRARGSAAAAASGSISLDVGRPRQRPLHEQQLVERAGRADRVDALRLRPRRAAELRIARRARPAAASTALTATHGTTRSGWGGAPIAG